MSILTQKTISKKISISGIGIHSGEKVNLTILPGLPNTGIVFKRIDLNKNNFVYPLYNNVIDTTLCTTISNDKGIKVSTIFLCIDFFTCTWMAFIAFFNSAI